MLREAYLSSEYTAEDKELIALFQKQLKKLNQLFQAALLAGDRTKALVFLKQMQAIHKSLNTEYGLRAQIRIPQEYLKGALYIDDHLNQASSLLRLKTRKKLSAFYMERITQLGPVHTEAVKALLDNSKMLVSASLSSSEKVAMNMINKYQQAQVRLKLAEWTIRGDWIEKMKKSLTQMFAKSWVDKFQDRAGRMRNVNRYVDMLTRTETKIANTQGTINRAIESGISKFEVIEQQNCCEICARYNGKIVDISKGAVELPPYHPNCRGYIVPVVDIPESRFWSAIDLKAKSLAEKAGIDGKNTLERVKLLNKYIKTKKWKWLKKAVYKVKDDIILFDIRSKGKILKDEWEGMTYKIKQGWVQVDWHLWDFRKTLKKLWRIKKQE